MTNLEQYNQVLLRWSSFTELTKLCLEDLISTKMTQLLKLPSQNSNLSPNSTEKNPQKKIHFSLFLVFGHKSQCIYNLFSYIFFHFTHPMQRMMTRRKEMKIFNNFFSLHSHLIFNDLTKITAKEKDEKLILVKRTFLKGHKKWKVWWCMGWGVVGVDKEHFWGRICEFFVVFWWVWG